MAFALAWSMVIQKKAGWAEQFLNARQSGLSSWRMPGGGKTREQQSSYLTVCMYLLLRFATYQEAPRDTTPTQGGPGVYQSCEAVAGRRASPDNFVAQWRGPKQPGCNPSVAARGPRTGSGHWETQHGACFSHLLSGHGYATDGSTHNAYHHYIEDESQGPGGRVSI